MASRHPTQTTAQNAWQPPMSVLSSEMPPENRDAASPDYETPHTPVLVIMHTSCAHHAHDRLFPPA